MSQADFRIAAGQGFLVVVAQRTGIRIVGIFPAVAEQKIDGGQVAAPGDFQFLIRSQAAVDALADLRVVLQGALNGLGQGHGMAMDTGDRQNYAAP
ncbi:hypothetical protein D3C81_1459100 [compost metagenome]